MIFTGISFVKNVVVDLPVYKEFVVDCVFYVLKLNFISFFRIVIISTSPKNKLIINNKFLAGIKSSSSVFELKTKAKNLGNIDCGCLICR